MAIPAITRRRPPLWQMALCMMAAAISFVGLAWVFTGGAETMTLSF